MSLSDNQQQGPTIEEKARLLTGTMWSTYANEALGLREIVMSDGPHGLRKARDNSVGLEDAVEATCFPPAVTLGSTFDVELAKEMGAAIGREAAHHGVDILLGPGVNLKRSPLCGRNFEYLSEDPVVSALLGAAYINGIQSNNVAACVKHYAANNQETRRMNVDAVIDERTLHELYLRSFEIIIEQSNPWSIMCSYNSLNGTFASENHELLSGILRDAWHYDGVVISDWGAVIDRARSLLAGLDLEMPGNDQGPARLVAAVRDGEVNEALLDVSIERLQRLAERTQRPGDPGVDYDAHHDSARRIAAAGIVLLKNETGLLPLREGAFTLGVIGDFAQNPRAQGNGSSRVNAMRHDDVVTALQQRRPEVTLAIARGFDSAVPSLDANLVDEALAVARRSDVVLVCLGLNEADEGEGYDRESIDLPEAQRALLADLAAVNPNIIVTLSNGSTVDVASWMHHAPTIVETWLGGQAAGGALCDVLTGDVNPSGRLAETIPLSIDDLPAQLNFPGEFDRVLYGERHHVGYRHFGSRLATAFAFGHGLSYTTFDYVEVSASLEDANLTVRTKVRNVGGRDGHEVVQVYVGRESSVVSRPAYELKGFSRVFIAAGEEREVTIVIPLDHLRYWDERTHQWELEGGEYVVSVGASSVDLRRRGVVSVPETSSVPLNEMSTIGEWLARDHLAEATKATFAAHGKDFSMFGTPGTAINKMFMNIRLNQVTTFLDFSIPAAAVAREINDRAG